MKLLKNRRETRLHIIYCWAKIFTSVQIAEDNKNMGQFGVAHEIKKLKPLSWAMKKNSAINLIRHSF